MFWQRTNVSASAINIHNGQAGEFVQARISLVNIYNRALTLNEIVESYNISKSKYGL